MTNSTAEERIQGGAIPELSLRVRLMIARDHAKLTQNDLARALGKDPKTIYRYEQGETKPKRGDVIEWALACGVNFGWLAGVDYPAIGRRSEGGGSSTIWSTDPGFCHGAWWRALSAAG